VVAEGAVAGADSGRLLSAEASVRLDRRGATMARGCRVITLSSGVFNLRLFWDGSELHWLSSGAVVLSQAGLAET
jgi:hypothetical protein